MPPPVTLRPLQPSDAPSIAELANNPRVVASLPDSFPYPYQLQNAEAWVAKVLNDPLRTNFSILVDGRYAGDIGLIGQQDVQRHSAELGYWLGESFWDRGVGTEAVRQAIDIAFRQFGLARLFAAVFENNPGSMRILEKNGFVREGVFPKGILKGGRYMDTHRFGLLNPDFDFGS